MAPITRERAALVAKGRACENCGEYSYKKVSIKPATASHRDALHVAWQATTVCGICGAEQELGIDDEGEIVYVS